LPPANSQASGRRVMDPKDDDHENENEKENGERQNGLFYHP
jgi:hypothetical protein